MVNGSISQIKLPNGDIYEIKDANTAIDSIYNENDYEVVLTVGSLRDADSTEY